MWWNIIIGLVLAAVSFFLKKPPDPPRAGTLADANVPKAKEGDELGLVHGTVWIKDPQVVWYGDFKSIAIKTKKPKK